MRDSKPGMYGIRVVFLSTRAVARKGRLSVLTYGNGLIS